MEQSTVAIIVAVVTALGSVIAAFVGWLAKRGVDYLDKKTSVLDDANQLVKKDALKERIVEVVTIAVKSTMQTFVDDIKAKSADGKLTKEERNEAYRRSYDTAIDILKSEGLEVGKEVLGTTIEAVVGSMNGVLKNGQKGEELPQPVPVG